MTTALEETQAPESFRGAKVRRGYFPRHLWRRVSKIAGFKGVSLLAYLWTCEPCNRMGYFPFSLQYAVGDLRLSLKEVKNGVKELERAGYIKYDDTNEVMLLHDYMIDDDRIKLSKISKNLKGCLAYLRQIPASHLFADFVEEAKKHTPDLVKVLLQPSLINSKGHENYIADIKQNWKAISPDDHLIHQLTNENGYENEYENEIKQKPHQPTATEGMLLQDDVLPMSTLFDEHSDPSVIAERIYPGDEHTEYQLENIRDALNFVSEFKERYQRRKGKRHADVYGEGLISVLEEILYWYNEGYDNDYLEEWTDQYFSTRFSNCDYQIWHFFSGDIIKIFSMRQDSLYV